VKRTHAVSLVLGLIAALFLMMAAQAFGQQPTQLYAFRCTFLRGCPDGSSPQALIQAADGNFYGATQGGGGKYGEGSGTIFKLTPSGRFTLLYTFLGFGDPVSLVEASDGNLYGLTAEGTGTAFKVSKKGSGFQDLHDFGTYLGGAGTLTVGKDGNLYGSTVFGGATNVCVIGCGTIFTIDVKAGVFTTVYELNGTSDGANPSGLIQASDGSFYGTTQQNVFRVTPSGTFTVVSQLPAGYQTFGGVIQASDGSLYGMLNNGGPRLFKLALDGSGFHAFPVISSLQHIGALSTLLRPTDGNLWFTTFVTAGSGAIVSVSPDSGSLLQSIAWGADGTPLIQATNGELYGTASGGKVRGDFAGGQVFRLNAGHAASQPAP